MNTPDTDPVVEPRFVMRPVKPPAETQLVLLRLGLERLKDAQNTLRSVAPGISSRTGALAQELEMKIEKCLEGL